MSKSLLVCGVVAASAAGVAGNANAGSIFVENASFEAAVLTDGTFVATAPEGWTLLEGKFGSFDPLATSFPIVPDGENTAFSNGGTIAQILSAVLEVNTVYSLEVEIGNRPETPFPGFAVQLWAGDNLLAEDVSSFEPPGQGFTTSLVNYVALPEDTMAGQTLQIRLVSLGIQVNFDDVRLNGSPLPAPGALALFGLAGLGCRRRRRR
ncbi:MAG: PEP-CTERM sorting domain-containing protein [Planctomycetota bacterium]|jgi:MYXO-CTERM domain-containing protein